MSGGGDRMVLVSLTQVENPSPAGQSARDAGGKALELWQAPKLEAESPTFAGSVGRTESLPQVC